MYPVVRRIVDRMKLEAFSDEQLLKLKSYEILKNARLNGNHIIDYRHRFLLKFDLFAETCLELRGFHEPEDWGTWVSEKEAFLSFLLLENLRGEKLKLTFTVKSLSNNNVSQKVNVFIDDTLVNSINFTNDKNQIIKIYYSPKNSLKSDNLKIGFISEFEGSPSDNRKDKQKLFFALLDMNVKLDKSKK
jgi:hypothetical protein